MRPLCRRGTAACQRQEMRVKEMGRTTSIPVSIAFPREGYFLINAAVSGSCFMVNDGVVEGMKKWLRKGIQETCNSSETQFNQTQARGKLLLLI